MRVDQRWTNHQLMAAEKKTWLLIPQLDRPTGQS